jgi:hypothetical protein
VGNQQAIETTLRYVLSLPRSSGIGLTFCLPDDHAGEDASAVRFFSEYGATLGEPWISLFEPARMLEWLRELGFSRIAHLSPAQARERYFRRSDGLPVPIYEQLVSAIV